MYVEIFVNVNWHVVLIVKKTYRYMRKSIVFFVNVNCGVVLIVTKRIDICVYLEIFC